jgi:heptosyltransferase-2
VRRRLLVFAPNWLGDAVMALPAIADVRRAWPGAAIDVAARPSVAPLFTLVPDVNEVRTLGKGRAAAASLRDGRYEAALLLPNSFNVARLAWSAGIPERWGYRSDFRSPLLTAAVAAPTRVHQAEYYRHLVRALGLVVTSPAAFDSAQAGEAGGDERTGPAAVFARSASAPKEAGHSVRDMEPAPLPQLNVSTRRRDAARAQLVGNGWEPVTPLVAVAPGAAFGGAKRWPAASYAALIDAFAADGIRVVVIGAVGDRLAATEVLGGVKAAIRPFNLVGQTDLPALAGVLVHCRALVTNDSGAMHLAAALGVPVTAMFGPTRERETHPLGDGHRVLTHAVWCRPCMLRECPLTHRCMTGITVESVLAATRARL